MTGRGPSRRKPLMSGARCRGCVAPATVRQHPAGRLDGQHVAEDFWIPYCNDCHETEHAIRRRLGLEHGPEPTTRSERAGLVLRRVAVTLGLLGGPLFKPLAALLVCLAELITSDVVGLDAALPGWREAIG